MNKNALLYFALLSCSIWFSSCGDDATDDAVMPEYLIIPGQGIDNLKIGDLGSRVEAELGSGYQRFVNVGGSGNATYNYFSDAKGMDIIFGQHSSGDLDINTLPIKSFALFGDFEGMTAEGIKIGSTKAEVIDAFGDPDETDIWSEVYYLGMLISYDDMDRVRDIAILEI